MSVKILTPKSQKFYEGYSMTKQTSLIFSSFLLPFLGIQLEAADCIISGSTPCVDVSAKDNITASVSDTSIDTPDKKQLRVVGALDNPSKSIDIKANKSILNVGNLSIRNGSTINATFQDSLWNSQGGKLSIFQGGFANNSTLNFTGAYQGNSEPSLKGYAFVGDMMMNVGIVKVNFKDNANMKGMLLTEGNNVPDTGRSLNVSFTKSSLEGSINTNYNRLPDYPTLNVTFNNNSSKGFAFNGSVAMNSSNLNITFNDGAIWKNASIRNEFGTTTINANSGSKIFFDSLLGPGVGGSGSFNNPDRRINLNNSIFQGLTEFSIAKITNFQGNISFNANNNSKVYANFNSQYNFTINDVPRNSTLKFDSSSLIGNITNTWKNSPRGGGMKTIATFSKNNSNDGFAFSGSIQNDQGSMDVSFSNGAIWKDGYFIANDTSSISVGSGAIVNADINANKATTTITVSGNSTIKNIQGAGKSIISIANSNIGNINTSNLTSTLDFAYTRPASADSVSNTAENLKPTYRLGDISFAGKVSGNIYSSNIRNLTLNNNRDTNFNVRQSTINSITIDNGAYAVIGISNSVIGNGNKIVLNSNWGILKSTLEGSIIKGDISWGDGTFADKNGNTINGLTFSANSKLIGNISAPTGGNFSTVNNFTFNASSMEGDIFVKDKTKSDISNTVGVNFLNKSSFKGLIKAQGSAIVNVSFADTALDIGSISAYTDTSSILFSNIKNAKIGDIYFTGTLSGDMSASNIGNIKANNGSINLKLDTSSIGDISNTNSQSKISFSYTAPIAGESSPKFNRTSIGNIDFNGQLSGQLSYVNIGNINNSNVDSNLNITNIASSSFVPSVEKPFDYFIGDIKYSGKLTAQLEHTKLGDLSLSGNANSINFSKNSMAGFLSISSGDSTFGISDSSIIGGVSVSSSGKLNMNLSNAMISKNSDGSKNGSISIDNANATLVFDKSILAGGISNANKAILDISFKNGSTLLGSNITSENQAFSYVSFSSEINKIDFAKADENLISTVKTLIENDSIKFPYPIIDPRFQVKKEDTAVDEKPVDDKKDTEKATEAMPVELSDKTDESSEETPTLASSAKFLAGALSTGDSLTKNIGTLSAEDMKKANLEAFQAYLMSSPELVGRYLYDSGIASYYGNILVSNSIQSIDFSSALYLGGVFKNSGGNANVTMIFSDDFINKIKTSSLIKSLLFDAEGPSFHIITQASEENSTPITNIALAGDVKGKADVFYQDGYTNIIFSDSETGSFSADNITKLPNSDFSNYVAGSGANLNGYSFSDGILVRLDASKANTLLSPYRDLFANNHVAMFVDKITDNTVYKAFVSGILVGEVDSLAYGSSIDGSSRMKSYEAILNKDAVFIGKFNIQDTHTSIKLSQGSKLILENGSQIANLSSATQRDLILDKGNIIGDSLTQTNTIIDLATNGIPSVKSNQKTSFSTLNIDHIRDLNNAIFRVAYNPNANVSDLSDQKSDHIIIDQASRSDSSSASLSNYIQAYQNTLLPVLENLSAKNILVASVKNSKNPDGSYQEKLQFNTQSSVLQGYDIIHTNFEKRIENSSDGNTAISVAEADKTDIAPKADEIDAGVVSSGAVADTTQSWTNYYIKSASAFIQDKPKAITEAAISSSYSIFLANINDLNKRLGELRSDTKAQGIWARVFNGLTTTNRGEEVKTYFTNVQAGYDYAIPTDSSILGSGQSIFGFAFSYGHNTLKSPNFKGQAAMIEAGLYYSYVGDSGFYSDSIAKYAFIDNKLELQNNQKTNTSLDVSSLSYGQEFGYRWYFTLKEKESSKHSIYLEPQVEGILGYMTNGGFDQINGNSFLSGTISSILAIRAKSGGVLAYSFKNNRSQTDFRVGLSYVNDFLQGGDIYLKSNMANSKDKIESNSMVVASFGINSSISDAWKLYLDVESGFLGKTFNQDYLVSVGGRYSFGKRNLAKLTPSNINTQLSKIPAGFYLEVYALPVGQKLTDEQEALLKKYPYAIDYQTRIVKQNDKTMKVDYKVYLLGAFKSKQGALNNQKIANEISSMLYNQPNTQAFIKEVK